MLLYAFSIAIFCFLTYTLALWVGVYECKVDFKIVPDVNPGHVSADAASEL